MIKIKEIFALLVLAPVIVFAGKAKKITKSENVAVKLPIIFHNNYNVPKNLHPFGVKKYDNIAKLLMEKFNLKEQQFYTPEKISDADLLLVHTKEYLESLNSSQTIAQIAENPMISSMPNSLLQKEILDPMRLGTFGTILGAQLALEHGWAINLSGGYHHAKRNLGGGFCYFSDIPLAIVKARAQNPKLKVLVVDLDAHQGNGVESYLEDDKQTFMFDVYGANNYPHDTEVMKHITFNFPVLNTMKDEEYLDLLKKEIPQALNKIQPDLIIYNAGIDIYENDPIGRMSISRNGIIERDFFLFSQARLRNIPILMVLSGGYSDEGSAIVGESIEKILREIIKPNNKVKLKNKNFKKYKSDHIVPAKKMSKNSGSFKVQYFKNCNSKNHKSFDSSLSLKSKSLSKKLNT